MNKEQKSISFSQLSDLNYSNIAMLPQTPSLYMICKKDASDNNQVILAGVAYNLKTELTKYLEANISISELTFCYIPTSAKNVIKHSNNPLYQRVA